MKRIPAFLVSILALMTCAVIAAPVPSTVGSNLTAYNPSMGADDNARWNTYMNPRSNGALTGGTTTAPTADFGNCNALILRCAQPKCADGGCSTMDIARPIVTGCVQSNETCSKYGTDLIEFISAQLVSDANAAAQTAAANAQIAAANAAAQQSNQQIAAMQQQMQQMQQQMQQQSADTAAQIQAALAQQQAATQQAIADAATANAAALNNATAQMQQSVAQSTNAATTTATNTTPAVTTDGNLTTAQQIAAQSGVSAEVLAREQIAGQILTRIENAETNLNRAKQAMQDAFDYAGCDSTGSNCIGPKRVSTFKHKAMDFFDPYNDVLNELYEGLILAQSAGIDITDIYMMLNGTCNVWGQYLCAEGQVMHYTSANCIDGKSVPDRYSHGGTVFGGADCKPGQVVPMSDGGCQLIKMLTSEDEVQRNWLYPETGTDGVQVRVGCASEVLDNSFLFRNLKRQADIDIDTLQRIIEQDAPSVFGHGRFGSTEPYPDGVKFCAIGDESFAELQTAASLRQLPDTVCVPDDDLDEIVTKDGRMAAVQGNTNSGYSSVWDKCSGLGGYQMERCLCENAETRTPRVWRADTGEDAILGQGKCECLSDEYSIWNVDNATCTNEDDKSLETWQYIEYVENQPSVEEKFCNDHIEDGAKWDSATEKCDCSGVTDTAKRKACEAKTGEIKHELNLPTAEDMIKNALNPSLNRWNLL